MSDHPASNEPPAIQRLGAGHIVAIVIGSLLAVAGAGSLVGAGVLGWANATQRDSRGFFSTSTDRFSTPTYAITSDRIDLNSGAGPGDWFTNNDNIATVRIRAKTVGGVFVGIGPQANVERYLANVAHDEVTNVTYRPFAVTYRRSAGTLAPVRPADEAFWVAKIDGEGTQTLTWAPTAGAWAVVVMNRDATEVVNADVALGLRVSFLGWVISGLAVGGAMLLAAGAALVVTGAARSHPAAGQRPPGAPTSPGTRLDAPFGSSAGRSSPVRLEGRLTEPLSRWLWIVKWLLLIPHVIVLAVLWLAFGIITVVAAVAIVFTGRYPRSLFDFNVGVLRWTWRVQFYGPSAYGTDFYPPFTLDHSDYPATLEIEYPEHLSRWMVFVKSWLLAIPHLIIVGIFTAGWSWTGDRNGSTWRVTELGYSAGLIGICTTIAGIVLLIRRAYPTGLFDFILGMNRWVYRVIAYVALMTDQYPPFHFDGGPTEPSMFEPLASEPLPR